jgi:hypothetical protein
MQAPEADVDQEGASPPMNKKPVLKKVTPRRENGQEQELVALPA